MKEELLRHWALYPAMELRDCVKLLYQSEFAGGHIISNEAESLAFLQREADEAPARGRGLFEPIGGGLCRLHLGEMARAGLSPWLANRFFVVTAEENQGTRQGLAHKLERLQQLCDTGELPFSGAECREFLDQYRAQGCPAIHHSQGFRQAYAPHYRVVSQSFARWCGAFLWVESQLGRKNTPVLAVDGCSGSGKSELAGLLAQVYGNGVVHLDDFFLQPGQRTPERLAEPGGNIDYERFQREVLPALPARRDFNYQAFDCGAMALGGMRTVAAAPFTLVEGVYAMHPRFRGAYDGALFLTVPREVQLERIARRSGPLLERFQREWIPLEDRYFTACGVAEACDCTIDTSKEG